jgi:hypothetical protein
MGFLLKPSFGEFTGNGILASWAGEQSALRCTVLIGVFTRYALFTVTKTFLTAVFASGTCVASLKASLSSIIVFSVFVRLHFVDTSVERTFLTNGKPICAQYGLRHLVRGLRFARFARPFAVNQKVVIGVLARGAVRTKVLAIDRIGEQILVLLAVRGQCHDNHAEREDRLHGQDQDGE